MCEKLRDEVLLFGERLARVESSLHAQSNVKDENPAKATEMNESSKSKKKKCNCLKAERKKVVVKVHIQLIIFFSLHFKFFQR